MRWVETLYLSPQANSPMLKAVPKTSADLAATLLIHYSFDLNGYTANELVNRWQRQYPVDWLHLAVIEALYQGRYKGISVQQILILWQRRGQPTHHFNMEFERLICSKFPESLTELAAPVLPPVQKQIMFEKVSSSQTSPVLSNALSAKIGNGYQHSQTTTLQLPDKAAQERFREDPQQQRQGVLTSVSGKTSSASINLQRDSKDILQRNSLSSNSQTQTKLLPPSVTHPPIGQFTPETSDRSESFTSKLKAMSVSKAQRLSTQLEF